MYIVCSRNPGALKEIHENYKHLLASRNNHPLKQLDPDYPDLIALTGDYYDLPKVLNFREFL